jgi:hypothetical protein
MQTDSKKHNTTADSKIILTADSKIILTAGAGKKFKPSKKHLSIFKRIAENGYYKPAYSDQEPATATLEKKGIVEWRGDFIGVILTEYGKELVELNGW